MLTLQKTSQHSDLPENLKTLLTDPLTKGQDWVRGDAIAPRKKYFPKSQFYKVEFVYRAVFLVCIISSKNAQTKFHAWKLEASVHSFDIPEWLQSTMYIVHKPNTKIKIHGLILALSLQR